MLLIGGVITEILESGTIITDNNIKEKCVIISIEKENLKYFKNTAKVKFNDGVVEIKKVEEHLVAGDTILVTR